METYEETRNAVRMGKEYTEKFWTTKGLRQGCPMSSILFNIYIADLEEYLKKGQEGGEGKNMVNNIC